MNKKIKAKKIRNTITLSESDFQKLHSKGFGEKTNKLFTINTYEALFFVEKDKLEITNSKNQIITPKDLLKQKNTSFEEYLVFADLVKNGYDVKSGLKYGFTFRIYPKGEKKGQSHAEALVWVTTSNKSIKTTDFAGLNRVAHSTRKNVLLAIVDNENSVTYFKTNWTKI